MQLTFLLPMPANSESGLALAGAMQFPDRCQGSNSCSPAAATASSSAPTSFEDVRNCGELRRAMPSSPPGRGLCQEHRGESLQIPGTRVPPAAYHEVAGLVWLSCWSASRDFCWDWSSGPSVGRSLGHRKQCVKRSGSHRDVDETGGFDIVAIRGAAVAPEYEDRRSDRL